MTEKIVIWGTGKLVQIFEKYIDLRQVISFIDSDTTRQGTVYAGRPVMAPEELNRLSFDRLIIFVSGKFEEIFDYATKCLHIEPDRIFYWSHYYGYYNIEQTMSIMREDLLQKGISRLLDYGLQLQNYNVYTCDQLELWGCGDVDREQEEFYGRLYSRRISSLERYLEQEYPDALFAGRIVSAESAAGLDAIQKILNGKIRNLYFTIPYGDTAENRSLQRLKQTPAGRVKVWHLFYEQLVCIQAAKEQDIRVFIAAHRESGIFCDDMYEVLWLGPAGKNRWGYPDDRAQPSIADLNPLLNECTALYWIWKHVQCKYTGLVHYRRYFQNSQRMGNENILGAEQAERILKEYDIITAPLAFYPVSIREQLKMTVVPEAFEAGWQIVEEQIRISQPEYLERFWHVMNGHAMFPCNMFITRKGIFDRYCEWLFSIVTEAARRIDVTAFPAYSKRIIGFFAERLFTVWLSGQLLRIKEMPVWVTEYVEDQNTDVTRLSRQERAGVQNENLFQKSLRQCTG